MNNAERFISIWYRYLKPFSVLGMTASDGEARVIEFGECGVPLPYRSSQIWDSRTC